MRVAVIGVGYWGKNHVRDFCNLGHEVVACDINEERLKELSTQFKIETTTSLETILNDSTIKAVTVCTPNDSHFEIAKKLIEHEKHLLVEKPLCVNSIEAKELVKLAEEKGIILTVGHIFRFNNPLKKAKELIDSNDLGDLYYVKAVWTNLDPVYPDRDILFDLALHPIDIIDFLLEGKPEKIACVVESFRRNSREELAFISGKKGKTLLNIEVSWLTPKKVREITIVGSSKTLIIDCLNQKISLINNLTPNNLEEILIEKNNPLVDELSSFIKTVENNLKPRVSARKGLEIVETIEKIRNSILK
jgi:predicted dehydrogenase